MSQETENPIHLYSNEFTGHELIGSGRFGAVYKGSQEINVLYGNCITRKALYLTICLFKDED